MEVKAIRLISQTSRTKFYTVRATILITLCVFLSPLQGAIENSIIPAMDELCIKDLQGKINQAQATAIINAEPLDERLRVISFNMLFNLPEAEKRLPPQHHWTERKERVLAYLQWSHPDIIGSQELQQDQIHDLMSQLDQDYAYYGLETIDGHPLDEVTAIFYKKARLELLEGQTLCFDQEDTHSFTICRFKDKMTGSEFIVLNTHLAFCKIEKRYEESCILRDIISNHCNSPLLLMGDFNTFPFRQELDLPFFDGPSVLQVIMESGVIDSILLALFGHFGPIASTNFCPQTKQSFSSQGTPGVILDYIFVTPDIHVIAHGIDPATVDGDFPSDHFPVIADLLIPSVN